MIEPVKSEYLVGNDIHGRTVKAIRTVKSGRTEWQLVSEPINRRDERLQAGYYRCHGEQERAYRVGFAAVRVAPFVKGRFRDAKRISRFLAPAAPE